MYNMKTILRVFIPFVAIFALSISSTALVFVHNYKEPTIFWHQILYVSAYILLFLITGACCWFLVYALYVAATGKTNL